MRRLRILIAFTAILAMGTSSFAGDFRDSVAKAARDAAAQQETEQRSGNRNPYLWPGAALFIAGMSMATYGFLHTSGSEFVSGEVSKESKTGLGGAGLAVAAAGGALLYCGTLRAHHAPSVTVGRGRVTVAKHVSW
jgi:hypothetical protein